MLADHDAKVHKTLLITKQYINYFLCSACFNISSNPQPIGFRGILLVKRQKFFYCTYSLGITETS